jgi:ATP dependent DNA ligase domain
LEGELLVWSDRRHRLEPFHKIRKHVKRSGRFLGTLHDSPVDPNEHLMIMFYDILLLDNVSCIKETLKQQRQRLCSLVQCIRGLVGIGSREIIDFLSDQAPRLLQEVFTRAVTRRWEGLVLKGCDDPFFSLDGTRFIKLKKDYIAGLGDTADLAIVGGRRDVTDEQELNIGRLRWTSFFIGCLENKDEVRRSNAKPHFRILDAVGHHNIPKIDIRYLNEQGNFVQVPFASSTPGLSVTIDQKDQSQPTELFKRPFVVEVMGAGFDKPANVSYFTLHFPRVQKVHLDRTLEDTVSFGELQEMARAANTTPQDDDEERNIFSSPSLSNRSTSTESSQSSINTATASPALSLDEWMRAEGLVMIEEPETTTANPEEQRAEPDCQMGPTDFKYPSLRESVRPLPTERKRNADTVPPENGCQKRIRMSTDHVEDDQHKRRQSASAITSNASKTSERYELVAAESQSQNIYSIFIPPFFLSLSLFHLFSHPTQPLCKILHRLQIPVVFSTDSVVDCGSTTSVLKSMADRSKPVFRVVFVDAAQVDAVAWELESMVKAMMKHHASGQLLTDHRVLFFDWNVLKGPERPEEVSELEWRGAFVGGVLSGCDQIQIHLGEILD